MPAKLEECVQKLISEGKTEESAYAICTSALDGCEKFGTPDCCMVRDSLTTRDDTGCLCSASFATSDAIAGNFVETDEGYVVFEAAKLARSGVQLYYAFELGTPDGFKPMDRIRVYRPEDEVFDEKSMKSFSLKPVTNNHPPVLVNGENIREFQVGVVGEQVSRDEDFLVARIVVTDPKVIAEIKDGKVELSNGYTSDYEFKQGKTPNGEEYDAIQRNIRGNHVAIVDKGRCGGACRVLDSVTVQVSDTGSLPNYTKESDKMETSTVSLHGVDVLVPKSATQAFKKSLDEEIEAKKTLEERVADLEEALKKQADELTAAKKEKEKAEGDRDAARAELANLDIDKLVSDRKVFLDTVAKINKDFDASGKSEEEVIRALVIDAFPSEKLESKSSDYIRARFDALAVSKSNEGDASLKSGLQRAILSKDSGVPNAESAREAFIKRNIDSYKLPSERTN